jgi:hypothetical protein
MIVIAFIFAYFEIIDKLMVWLLIKEHYSSRFTKEGLKKSVAEFVSTFHKLSEELLDYNEAKRMPSDLEGSLSLKSFEAKESEAPKAHISQYEG